MTSSGERLSCRKARPAFLFVAKSVMVGAVQSAILGTTFGSVYTAVQSANRDLSFETLVLFYPIPNSIDEHGGVSAQNPSDTTSTVGLPESQKAPPAEAPETLFNMIEIPGGVFKMGLEYSKDGVKELYLDTFWIDKYEVTNSQFDAFEHATGYNSTSRPKDKSGVLSLQQPVQASWHDAAAYAKWAGKRLPTEAEWEKAARGTDGRMYPWGDGTSQSYGGGAPSYYLVGAFLIDNSPYGVMDMAGSVSEWTSGFARFGEDPMISGGYVYAVVGRDKASRQLYGPAETYVRILQRIVVPHLEVALLDQRNPSKIW